MSISIVTSSAGTKHAVHKQVDPNSCGCACILMAIYRQTGKEIEEWVISDGTKNFEQGKYEKTAKDGTKISTKKYTPYGGDSGLSAGNIAIFLRKVNFPDAKVITSTADASCLSFFDSASADNPVIAQVAWNGANAGRHWVVVDGVQNGNLMVCDPGHGNLQETQRGMVFRDRNGQMGRFSGIIIPC
ncbi:MAG: hypothetical protein AAGD13_05985 [Pseudomonadota bacterium]